jgi:SAM-dependent methyltransferase
MKKIKHWVSRKITRERLESFLKSHATEKYTLDLGSSWSPYAAHFPNRVSCDIEARKEVDVVADAHNLPFKDSEFEVILCSEVLEHLHTPEKAASEIWRVLKPGGELILTTRFMFPMHDVPHDYFRFTESGMKYLFREWTVEELIPETINFETMAVLIHRMALMMELRGGKFTRTLIFLLSKIVQHLGFLVTKEYGRRQMDGSGVAFNTFASGYYLYARKPV